MGQRLNIEICNNTRTLANAYYHWGAYTSSALEYTAKIIDAYYNLSDKITDDLELAVKLRRKRKLNMILILIFLILILVRLLIGTKVCLL